MMNRSLKLVEKMYVDNRSDAWANNQADDGLGIEKDVRANSLNFGSGNRPDTDSIIDNAGQRDIEDTSDIKANLSKNFNNDVFVVVMAKLSRIISDKHAIYFSTQSFVNIINNFFKDLFSFLITLSSFPFFLSLLHLHAFFIFNSNDTSGSYAALTTGNSGNIFMTFTHYMFIYM